MKRLWGAFILVILVLVLAASCNSATIGPSEPSRAVTTQPTTPTTSSRAFVPTAIPSTTAASPGTTLITTEPKTTTSSPVILPTATKAPLPEKRSLEVPQEEVRDPTGDIEIGAIDITSARVTVDGETIKAEIKVASLSEEAMSLPAGKEWMTYSWDIVFHVPEIKEKRDFRWWEFEYTLSVDYAIYNSGKKTIFYRLNEAEIQQTSDTSWRVGSKIKREGNGEINLQSKTIRVEVNAPEVITTDTRWGVSTLNSAFPYPSVIPRDYAPDKIFPVLKIPGNNDFVLRQKLAEKFTPILWLHPEEVYEPKEVSIIVDQSIIRDENGGPKLDLEWKDPEKRLFWLGDQRVNYAYLDFKRMKLSDGSDKYAILYANLLKDQYETTVYTRVVQQDGKTIIQYWFFYFFNDGPINAHEGDWEVIQLIFDGMALNLLLDEVPESVFYSQHMGGETKKWNEVTRTINHPSVYIAKGSHAGYFQPGNWAIGTFPGSFDNANSDGRVVSPLETEKAIKEIGVETIRYELVFLSWEVWWPNFKGQWGEGSSLSHALAPSAQDIWKNPLK